LPKEIHPDLLKDFLSVFFATADLAGFDQVPLVIDPTALNVIACLNEVLPETRDS
jgi:hypothetical protein